MDHSMEDKCEHLMNVVVESRKRFGKMCIDYDQKTSLMENKILNLQLETISNYIIKPKHSLADFDNEDSSDELDSFMEEIASRQSRLEKLQEKIRDTQRIAVQLKTDDIAKKVLLPLDAEAMLAIAKAKRAGNKLD